MSQRQTEMVEFYVSNPALVSSPFVKAGTLDHELLQDVFHQIGLSINGGIIVDVGCGLGLMSQCIRNHDSKYLGLDLLIHHNSTMLVTDNISFATADSGMLPLKDKSVSVLFCIDSFEHYPDQQSVAREFERVLKDDGAIFLSVPNYSNVAGLVKKHLERSGRYAQKSWAPFDYWKPQVLEEFMTPKRVRKIFETAGFTNYSMIGYEREMIHGLFPWIWHQNFPAKMARALELAQKPVQRLLARWFPKASLHNFWRIAR